MLGLLSCSTSEQVLLNAIQKGRGKGKPASVFLVAEWQAAGWTHAWQMAFQRVFMNHLGCVQWLQTTLTTKPEGLLRERGGGRGQAERKRERKDNQEVRKPTRGLFPGTGRWEQPAPSTPSSSAAPNNRSTAAQHHRRLQAAVRAFCW